MVLCCHGRAGGGAQLLLASRLRVALVKIDYYIMEQTKLNEIYTKIITDCFLPGIAVLFTNICAGCELLISYYCVNIQQTVA